ncbi:MBL fold metallo-hydrolase [bacterium]|nr:MBL fold metallo-hydrolase [bacterium]
MSNIIVLVKGYARRDDRVWVVSPTSVLIEDSGMKILVDPGANRELLEQGFASNNIDPSTVNGIFLTHCHIDHILNLRLFPEAILYDGDTFICDDRIKSYSGRIPGTYIRVIHTPGHTARHYSLLVNSEDKNIGIAGDLFWWKDGEKQLLDEESLVMRDDPFAEDMGLLMESRRKFLGMTDYIIPGHGEKFRVIK